MGHFDIEMKIIAPRVWQSSRLNLVVLDRRSKADQVGVGYASLHDKVFFSIWAPAEHPSSSPHQCCPPKLGSSLPHSFSAFMLVVSISSVHIPFLQAPRNCRWLVTCSSCPPRMHGKCGQNGGNYIVSEQVLMPPPSLFWSLKDTDILHLEVPGQSIIVLNSYEAAKELLERRSAIYSSR